MNPPVVPGEAHRIVILGAIDQVIAELPDQRIGGQDRKQGARYQRCEMWRRCSPIQPPSSSHGREDTRARRILEADRPSGSWRENVKGEPARKSRRSRSAIERKPLDSLAASAMLIPSLLRGTTRRAILFPTSTHQGAAPDRWMCTPASREARCGHHCGSPLTKVGAEEFSPTGHRGRLKFFLRLRLRSPIPSPDWRHPHFPEGFRAHRCPPQVPPRPADTRDTE